MQKSCFLPENINVHIHRPACPKCRAHMMLARILPARMGFDLHLFERPKCNHVHEVMIETDALAPRQPHRSLVLLSQKKRLIQKVAGEVLSESVTG
jgi:hypothetical protein